MENKNNTYNTTNKPLSLLTSEFETSLVNVINKYTSVLHPSIIEMVVNKVYTSACSYAEQQAIYEKAEYEKALAEQETNKESTK